MIAGKVATVISRVNMDILQGGFGFMRLANCLLILFLVVCVVPVCAQPSGQGKIRVAVYLDRGARLRPQLKETLSHQEDMRMDILDGADVREGSLQDFDLLLIPGGSAKKEAGSLTAAGRREIRRFVESGGDYIGICAGCYLATDSSPEYLGLLPMKVADRKHWHRGKAVLPVELTDRGMEIFNWDKRLIHVTYHNGPILKYPADEDASAVSTLAHYRGEIVAPGGELGVMKGAPAMVLGSYGRGRVIGISPHPEHTEGLHAMIPHAIRWLMEHPLP